MKEKTRRSFLLDTAKGAGLALSAASYSRVAGASERVNIALIGCGGRGRFCIRGLAEAGANVVALCDLNEERLAEAVAILADVQPHKPKLVKTMREVFDSNEIDAVCVATPDHWHGPASILALQAGKDVYVEKPHAHNIWESRKMIETARKYNRVLQAGTQNRSGAYNKAALEYINSGELGSIHLVKVYNLKPGGPFTLSDPGKMPARFDWDAWMGGTTARTWHWNIYKGGWHKFWEYSGGDMADDGIHQLDLAMMLMGNPGIPNRVSCSGGRLAHRGDDGEVPDTQVVAYDFNDFVMTFELSGYPKYMRKTTGTIRRKDEYPYWTQNSTRIELYGSQLMMTIGRHGGGWQVTTEGGRIHKQMYGRPCDEEHYQNFIECIKTRKRPNADVEIAHSACSMVHMANIAHRVGNTTLHYDAKKERFTGNDEANKLIKRKYRKGYEVPEKV